MWSTRVEGFDWLVLGATVLLALATVWVGSSILPGMFDYVFVSVLWALVGAGWTGTLLSRTTDRVARLAVGTLLVGTLITVLMLGPVTALIFTSGTEWVVIGLVVLALLTVFLARQRPIRLVWFVAPAIVLASIPLVLSGIPRSARFAAAEAELTTCVQGLDPGARSTSYEDPIAVAGFSVYEIIRDRGQVLLVTDFVGMLADDPAGLAYVPEGHPVGVSWDHISGPWYRWEPYGYASD
jgi:hypothetical protein